MGIFRLHSVVYCKARADLSLWWSLPSIEIDTAGLRSRQTLQNYFVVVQNCFKIFTSTALTSGECDWITLEIAPSSYA